MATPYQLYYWPMIPGRGEIVRLVLEEAGVEYEDVGRREGIGAITPLLHGGDPEAPVFAPPILKRGAFTVGQTAAICDYLGAQHRLAPSDAEGRARALQLFLTVLDVVDEAHDTHHPIGTALYYEDQKDAAKAAARAFLTERLPKRLAYFERVIEAYGGEHLLGAPSYPDLGLLQLLLGLEYAFPRGYAAAIAGAPKVAALRDRLAARPRIEAFRASDRSVPFNEDGIFRRYPELDLEP